MSEFVKLTLSEKEWTFRALDLDQIEQLEPQFETIGATVMTGVIPPKEFLQAVVAVACESLKYKHPDVTPAECRKMLTLGTMHEVIEAIRGVSSLEPKQGEAPAGVVV